MSTEDVIEYDLAILNEMDNNELLIQMIARKDLERPKREGDLHAADAKRQLDEFVASICEKFAALGLPAVVKSIENVMTEAYLEFNYDALPEEVINA